MSVLMIFCYAKLSVVYHQLFTDAETMVVGASVSISTTHDVRKTN
jgi:hypothetical protein